MNLYKVYVVTYNEDGSRNRSRFIYVVCDNEERAEAQARRVADFRTMITKGVKTVITVALIKKSINLYKG